MKNLSVYLMFTGAFLAQATLFPHLRFFGVTPNLLLCLVVLVTFFYENDQAILPGILFGLLQDLCFSPLIGPAPIAYFFVAILMGFIRILLYRDSIPAIFIASLVGTVVFQLISFGLSSMFGGTYEFLYVMKALPALSAYHFVITLLFYLAIRRRILRHSRNSYYRSRRSFVG